MLFDVQAALSEILAASPAKPATLATNGPDVANVANVAAQRDDSLSQAEALTFAALSATAPGASPQNGRKHHHNPDDISQLPAHPPRQDEACLHEIGYRHTWTGRLVRLDDWRQLSAWDRYGPAGRLFCGICKGWVSHDGNCGLAGCWKVEGSVT